MLKIKNLSDSDISEGLTIEFVNSINLKKSHSPVMFDFKDEPVKTLKCNNGYWVSVGFGEFLKNENNEMIVFKESEIQIARARYLFKNPEVIEPKKEVKKDSGQPVFGEPMFTARFDNPEEMKILKNVFSASALEEADFDMDKIKENLAKEQLSYLLNKS